MCCCCVDYLLTSLTIATSTHTNYFDHIFKERGAKAPLSRPIIQSRFSLSTPCRLLFLNPESSFPQPQVAGYYINLSHLVNLPFQLNPTSCAFDLCCLRKNCVLYSHTLSRQALFLCLLTLL